MIDSGSKDEKIIAIPKGDPAYNMYRDITELPAHIFEEMKHFFKVYKELENKKTQVEDIMSSQEAIKVIKECIDSYNEKFKNI